MADVIRAISKVWLLFLVIVLATIAVAIAVFASYPKYYTAKAQHTVEPIAVLSSGSTLNTVNMETESVVATSDAVLQRAADVLRGPSPGMLRAATTVVVPRSSQVLDFTVSTKSRTTSTEWANSIATAYGEQRIANARGVVEQTTGTLAESIQKLRRVAASQPVNSSERAATILQIRALLDQQARLQATPIYGGTLVTVAEPPASSDRPSALIFIGAGLFLGLLLGAIVSLIVSQVRDRRTADQTALRP